MPRCSCHIFIRLTVESFFDSIRHQWKYLSLGPLAAEVVAEARRPPIPYVVSPVPALGLPVPSRRGRKVETAPLGVSVRNLIAPRLLLHNGRQEDINTLHCRRIILPEAQSGTHPPAFTYSPPEMSKALKALRRGERRHLILPTVPEIESPSLHWLC